MRMRSLEILSGTGSVGFAFAVVHAFEVAVMAVEFLLACVMLTVKLFNKTSNDYSDIIQNISFRNTDLQLKKVFFSFKTIQSIFLF